MESLEQVLAIAYVLVVLVLVVAVPTAVHRDMKQRGCAAWAYVVLTLLVPPVGLLAWYIDRRRFPLLVNGPRQ